MNKILSSVLFLSIVGAVTDINASYNQHQFFNNTPFRIYVDGDYKSCGSEKHNLEPGKVAKSNKGACITNFVRGSVWTKNRLPAWTPPGYIPKKDEEIKMEFITLNGPFSAAARTFRFKGPYNGTKLLYHNGKWMTDAPYDTAGKYTYKIVQESEESRD